ncbi:MAG: TaqI-like C-terminal specificity domain-containing protein, partial [Nitrososphaerota archaeon]
VSATEYLAKRICEIENKLNSPEDYVERKRDVVRRCIYGVDVNPLAVDLAALSLWLETLSSEKPLSFLSAHLKTGNSLIGSKIDAIFENQMTLLESQKGRELFNKNVKDFLVFEHLEDDSPSAVRTKTEKYNSMQQKGTIYYDLKFLMDSKLAQSFGIKVPALGDYRSKIGENSIDFYAYDFGPKIKELSKKFRFFHWELEFPDVFYGEDSHKSRSGFDIIIGNPPYIRVQNIEHQIIDWLKQNTNTAYKRVDISILFFELSKQLLERNGVVSFIASNQFLISEYGRKTRAFLLSNFRIRSIIDFRDLPIFGKATTYVSIFTMENTQPANFRYIQIKNMEQTMNLNYDNSIIMDIAKLSDLPWSFGEGSLLEIIEKFKKYKKISAIGHAWGGIITGLDDIYLLDHAQIHSLGIEKELILPIIRGSDPKRYAELTPNIFVLYPYLLQNNKTVILPEEELKKRYPKAYQYLRSNKVKLQERKDSRKTFRDRKDWYGLVRFSQLGMFRKFKIVTPGEVKNHKFCLDSSGAGFSFARVYSITIEDEDYDIKYILALLNSKVVKFFLRKTAPAKKGGYFTYSSVYLNEIPIPPCSANEQRQIVAKVDELIKLNQQYHNKRTIFLNMLKTNLKITLFSNKLESFHNLNYEQFLREIYDQNIRLTLKDQDEWEGYFIMHKKSESELAEKISKIDSEVDDFAFSVYQVTSNEKDVIEEFLKSS